MTPKLRIRAWAVAAAATGLVAAAGWTWQRGAILREADHAYAVERWNVAYQLALESLRRDPDDRRSRLLAARSALFIGEFDAAESHFQRAEPTDVADLRLRVEGLIRLRAWEQAGRVCEQILALDPNDGLAAQRLAFTCYKRGDVERSIALCQQWGDHPKVGTNVRAMLGWIYFDRTDYAHATKEFEAVLAADPAPGDVPFSIEQLLLDLGRSLLRTGDPERAEIHLAQAAKQSTNSEVFWSLGRALQQQGQDAEAARRWLDALDWNPEFVPAMASLGEHALQQKRPEEALEWLTRALEIDPNLNRIHYGLQLAYTWLGDTERAAEHREIADRLRKEEQERGIQEQALLMSPRSPQARVQRALDEAGRGNWSEADLIIQELLAENPDNAQLRDLLERIRARMPITGPIR